MSERRLPRALMRPLAGMAGTTSQTGLSNQLASPDIIGTTSGASTAAVYVILVLGWSGMRVDLVAVVAGGHRPHRLRVLAGRADHRPPCRAHRQDPAGAGCVHRHRHRPGRRPAGEYAFPTVLPVGVVTGIVGAPYLVVQLIRISRQGASA